MACEIAERLSERPVGRSQFLIRAPIDRPSPGCLCIVRQLRNEACLSDPGLAGDKGEARLA